jgi:hypothetical protein
VRNRRRVLDSLEATYREAFERAKADDDGDEMARLDLDFQRDQLQLEVLLDIRDLLLPEEPATDKEGRSLIEEGSALIEKAGALRRMTRLL